MIFWSIAPVIKKPDVPLLNSLIRFVGGSSFWFDPESLAFRLAFRPPFFPFAVSVSRFLLFLAFLKLWHVWIDIYMAGEWSENTEISHRVPSFQNYGMKSGCLNRIIYSNTSLYNLILKLYYKPVSIFYLSDRKMVKRNL